jgi:putative transcriptional regulator
MQKLTLEKGIFLVSEPFLPDPNFKRTVVLLTEHDEDGSIGFVLNRKTNLVLNDVLEDFPEFPAPLYMGGPVEQNTLHYVHLAHHNIPGSKPVLPGLNWGGDFEIIKELVASGVMHLNDIRFFIGYSGWSVAQLEAEMDEKAWILSPADSAMVMQEPDSDLWKEVLSKMGQQFKLMANYPDDPRLN